ncbi:MAG: phosphopantothenoylcysteine decarboxylase [Endomicrobiales bacterium]|nr:phosphopantothenoylcysteine decarboxylase [Endomicrobiales bacterium]
MERNKKREILLGVCGGIAAYKVPELIRMLDAMNADVKCILTKNGSKFVTPLTLQTISGNKVYEGMFNSHDFDVEHISLAKQADLLVIVPATADVISRLACGRAEDLLSSVALSTKSPILVCPSMNENMWLHPATKKNVDILNEYGYKFVFPEKGKLACGDEGMGRLADLNKIVDEIKKILKNE